MGHNKGKAIDRSSPWSEYTWNPSGGYHVRNRYGPTGDIEYDYYYPKPAVDQTVPRTPAQDPIVNSVSSYQGSLDQTAVNNYSPDTVNSYTTSAPSDGTTYLLPTSPNTLDHASYFPASRQAGQADWSSGTSPNAGYTAASGVYTGATSSASYTPPAGPTYNASSNITASLSGMSISEPIPEHGCVEQSSNAVALPPDTKNIYKEPNSKDYEELDERYKVVKTENLKKFWKVGRVFMMLWTEPARSELVPSGGGTVDGSHLSTVWLKGSVYSEIRRFVVIGEGYGNTICSPIQTYSNQGTLKPRLPEARQHAIIYTGSRPPRELSYIASDGTKVQENLDKDPIRVKSEQSGPEGVLHEASRLNYSKVYTVENYVRVLNIGMVHVNSMESLLNNCYLRPRLEDPQGPREVPARPGTDTVDDRSRHRDRGKKKRR